ncbi:MAG TPA: hypothetical protein VN957_26060, partial [Chthoniobacterales bacterium]|nr:hypothetical protein [Chthoniobacterales bacterium]
MGVGAPLELVKAEDGNQTAPTPYGVPESFYNKFGQQVTHVLSGFDRIRFRGSLRMLFDPRK